MANFPIKAKNSCIFGFSWFLVVFGGFWPQKPPYDPHWAKKYLFLCHKKIWVMFGHSGVTLEKVQIWPYMATLGHSGPLYSPNGPKFGQTHKTPNFYHIVGTNPWVTKKFVIWWFFIDTLLKITRLKGDFEQTQSLARHSTIRIGDHYLNRSLRKNHSKLTSNRCKECLY